MINPEEYKNSKIPIIKANSIVKNAIEKAKLNVRTIGKI